MVEHIRWWFEALLRLGFTPLTPTDALIRHDRPVPDDTDDQEVSSVDGSMVKANGMQRMVLPGRSHRSTRPHVRLGMELAVRATVGGQILVACRNEAPCPPTHGRGGVR